MQWKSKLPRATAKTRCSQISVKRKEDHTTIQGRKGLKLSLAYTTNTRMPALAHGNEEEGQVQEPFRKQKQQVQLRGQLGRI